MTGTVFENARIHTLDPARPHAEAMLVRGERIVAVGDLDECRDRAGAGVRRVDLAGMAVLPGLIDSHLHSALYVRGLEQVDLRGTTSLDEALTRIARHAATLSPDAWLLGGRWDSHKWDRPVQPTRADLDRVCPDRPAVLPSIDGHTTWVNTATLRRLGIDADTPDPIGGQIARDERGEPTGILREAAGDAAYDVMRSSLAGDLVAQLRTHLPRLLAAGLTSIHDLDGQDCRAAYETLYARGELPLRVHKSIPSTALDEVIDRGWATGDGDRWLSTGPVKIFTDGALGSHTCLMTEPYEGEPHNHGIAVTPAEEFERLVAKAAGAGIAVAAHAIGDAANEMVLRAYARWQESARTDPTVAGAVRRLRHRIEHTQHLRPVDVPLLARLGVTASMQPTHCTSDIPLTSRMLAGRDLASYAWRSLLDAGATVAFGSDAPVEDPDPFFGIHAAVTRQQPDGTPPGGVDPHERVDLDTALRCFTEAGAYASYEEHLKGRLTPGMLADFIALPTDPYQVEPAALRDLTVALTVVGGVVRWQR
ncbi:amidohydrolase [Micromonospora sp. C31]|uniref:amidohydrolase n=1 Tax=Micromonospora sp. C31 TaxID=2824876 RepID=UPI001B370BC6|nr:amidohydrolase [Micromonospora sp. C31]MBQ1072760.1 amidohydrolase [Micromonospora sp. C31]